MTTDITSTAPVINSAAASIKSAADICTGELAPMAVGRYFHGDTAHSLPFADAEIARASKAQMRRIGTHHLRAGHYVVITSLFDESSQFLPTEEALHQAGLVSCMADASFYDAGRTESILRRFDIKAVIGVNTALLDGLEALGFNLETLFKGQIVWARPGAWERLQPLQGFALRRWYEIGPAVAMECNAARGAHLDALEWEVQTAADGEIILSSRLQRTVDFRDYHSGLHGHIERQVCACGSADPRIILTRQDSDKVGF
jgi:hypothetical protein